MIALAAESVWLLCGKASLSKRTRLASTKRCVENRVSSLKITVCDSVLTMDTKQTMEDRRDDHLLAMECADDEEPVLAAPSPSRLRMIARRLFAAYCRVHRTVDSLLLRFAAKSRWLSALYYTVVSRAFRGEQFRVVNGRVKHAYSQSSPQGTSAFLRRSIHRIEKGLLMRPWRDVYATDYIRDAVVCYAQALERLVSHEYDREELEWAYDVLTLYFQRTSHHPRIDEARSRFLALAPPYNRPVGLYVPYRRDVSQVPTVSYDQLLQLARWRRSVRWFQQRPVPRDLIDRALEVAALSPSACNRQPFVFRVLEDCLLVRRVAALAGGASGYDKNIPVLAVVLGQHCCYAKECDRHIIHVDAALASMAFIFALETLGLGSCCINWPDIEAKDREAAQILNLEDDESVVLLIAIGFPDPDGQVASSRKKPLGQLRRFNLE